MIMNICVIVWLNLLEMTPSFSYEPEVSPALGYGFRCGFLGLLHLEIIRDRFEERI